MAIDTGKILMKSVDAPDEVRSFALGHMDVVKLGDTTIGRAIFEPGWRWSTSVKPLVGTETCEVSHVGYVVCGRMRIRMNDGTEIEAGPGDVAVIAPGHDAWVVGDEPVEYLELAGAATYATQVHARPGSVTLLPQGDAGTVEPQTASEAALRADAGERPRSREQPLALMRRFIALANENRFEAFDEVFAADLVDHDAFPGQAAGLQGMRDVFVQFNAAFPDLSAEAGEPLVDGDRVACAFVMTGTHRGELMGIAPTGKAIRIGCTLIFRVANGRVVESWGTPDGVGLLHQLGVAPWQTKPPA